MRKISTAAVATGVGLASVLGSAAPGGATPSTTYEIFELAENGINGTLTRAQKRYLDTHPEDASIIVDATKTIYGEEAAKLEDQPLYIQKRVKADQKASGALANTCRSTVRYQVHRSYFGSTIAKLKSYVYWCYNSTQTWTGSQYPYYADTSGIVYNKKTVNHGVRSLSSLKKQIHHSFDYDLCVIKYGCYASLYKNNFVTVWNSSTTSLST